MAKNNRGTYGWHCLCYCIIFSKALWTEQEFGILALFQPHIITPSILNDNSFSMSFLPVRLWPHCVQGLEHTCPCSSLVLGLEVISAKKSRARLVANSVDFGESLGSNLTCTTQWDVHRVGYITFLCLSLFMHLVRIIVVSFLYCCWDDPMNYSAGKICACHIAG